MKSRPIALLLAALELTCAALLAAPTGQPTALPGVTRSTNNVYLFENHNIAYSIWHSLGVSNATVVHLDAHDDCRFIAPDKLTALAPLTAARDWQAIYEQSDLHASFGFRLRPDRFLFDLGNFLYPCLLDGTLTHILWVVPEPALPPARVAQLQGHLRNILRLPADATFANGTNQFSVAVGPGRITVTTLAALPRQPAGCLLDIDTDFFALPYALANDHIRSPLRWNPAEVCATLDSRVPRPAVVTIASSVYGGYLPIMFRFLSDAFYTYFDTGTYPEEAVSLLDYVTRLRAATASPGPPPTVCDPAFVTARLYLDGLLALATNDPVTATAQAQAAAAREPVTGLLRHLVVAAGLGG